MWKNYIKFASEKIQESWRSINLPFKSYNKWKKSKSMKVIKWFIKPFNYYNNFANENNLNPWSLNGLLDLSTIITMYKWENKDPWSSLDGLLNTPNVTMILFLKKIQIHEGH
jgi:hypothetical protein